MHIIILNYKNYIDTLECIDSILKQKDINYEIVIVDNASDNNSVKIIQEEYEHIENIHIVESKQNYGYATGNNIGIKYCQDKFGIQKILILNNDTILNDELYLKKLNEIKYSSEVGAIGTKIIGKDGQNQNPVYNEIGMKQLLKSVVMSLLLLSKININFSHKKKLINNQEERVKRNYILHGSAILLTEHYLGKASGLFPDTFLYFEENILAIIMEKMKLKMVYNPNFQIFHKEDMSSSQLFSNNSPKRYGLALNSVIKGVFVKIQPLKITVDRINKQDYLNLIKSKGN